MISGNPETLILSMLESKPRLSLMYSSGAMKGYTVNDIECV